MEDQKRLFIESANRLNIEYITEDIAEQLWNIFKDVNTKEGIDYIPDNICYCFTNYALKILSKKLESNQIQSIKKKALTVSLAEVIYSLCITNVDKKIANKLANVWIKRCHKIYIKVDEELKDIPKELWNWIFDDRDELYKKLLSLRICFIGNGEDLFSRVNIKNNAIVL